MPIQDPFNLPESAQDLPVPREPNATYFLNFIASTSPETKQPWCPDVRAALPIINAAFSAGDSPRVGFVHVGQIPEWKDLSNTYRTKWNVHALPTLVRYQRIDGSVKETARLIEGELLNQKRLQDLIAGRT